MPSPQTTVEMQGWPGVGQIQSVSVWQSGEQPSPPVRLPSSQVSAGEVEQAVAAQIVGPRRAVGRGCRSVAASGVV